MAKVTVYGSSPLARGLLGWRVRPDGTVSDHPRSRGVYVPLLSSFSLWLGSSPLARGLRTAQAARAPGPGIIPARAGFTSPPSSTGS